MDPFFFEIHSHLDREGPGDLADTRRALSYVEALRDSPRVLDVACGPGAQTLDLASLTKGTIDSVDLHEPFVNRLKKSIHELGLQERAVPRVGDMRNLDFVSRTFDVIWCEGALYIIGFETGLRNWKQLLLPMGYVVVTEPVWLKENPPAEVLANWREYPAMGSIQDNISKINACGYELKGHFTLSAQAWENYYVPLEKRALLLLQKYDNQPSRRAMLNETLSEISIYRHYSQYFGYEFFIMRAGAE